MSDTKESGPVENIRQELRDAILTGRKQRRQIAADKSRTALGEYSETDFYTTEFVTTMAQKLRKKSLDVENYRKLQNALIQSEENINAFLSVEHAILGLVRDLSGHSTPSKLAAANCCCNIALGNVKACTALCKNAAPYLVAELGSSNYPIVEVCVLTVGNLATGSEKACSILLAQGCFRSLINLADNGPSTILPSVSYGALHLAYAASTLPIEDKVDLACVLVNRINEEVDTDTMWLLALLSSEEQCLDSFIHMSGYIIEHLKSSNVSQVIAALRILGNTVSELSGQVAQSFLGLGDKTIEKFVTHAYTPVRKETLWILVNNKGTPRRIVSTESRYCIG